MRLLCALVAAAVTSLPAATAQVVDVSTTLLPMAAAVSSEPYLDTSEILAICICSNLFGVGIVIAMFYYVQFEPPAELAYERDRLKSTTSQNRIMIVQKRQISSPTELLLHPNATSRRATERMTRPDAVNITDAQQMNTIVANTTAQMGQLDDPRAEGGTDRRGSMQDFGDYDDGTDPAGAGGAYIHLEGTNEPVVQPVARPRGASTYSNAATAEYQGFGEDEPVGMESQSLAAKRSSMTGFDDDSATASEAPSPESMAGFEELDPADNRLSRGSVKSTNSGWFGGGSSRSSRSRSTRSTKSITKLQIGAPTNFQHVAHSGMDGVDVDANTIAGFGSSNTSPRGSLDI